MTDRKKVIKESEEAIDILAKAEEPTFWLDFVRCAFENALAMLKEQEPDQSKYEYKYDHTDCLWYWSGDLNQCPSTCSQYRDGWNDAMNYIFKGGKGYQPYKRR